VRDTERVSGRVFPREPVAPREVVLRAPALRLFVAGDARMLFFWAIVSSIRPRRAPSARIALSSRDWLIPPVRGWCERDVSGGATVGPIAGVSAVNARARHAS
jgi:hypothetical protein